MPYQESMSRAELKIYLSEHRNDSGAWEVFFTRLDQERSPGSQWYAAPLDEETTKITEQAIQQKVKELEAMTNEGL